MSVIDHFDKAPEAGFERGWSADSARRQFNVSLALIAALAFAVGMVAWTMRPAPPHKSVRAAAVVTGPSDFRPDIFGHLARQ
jgi:hypothetical protein